MGHLLLVDFTCAGCGTIFQDNPSQKRKFCKRRCKDVNQPKRERQSLICGKCEKVFYPISGHLKQKYCSRDCGQRRGRTKRTVTITKARNAQSLLSYHVKHGNIIKPAICESCGEKRKIEGAHYDYDNPLRVRWLCIPCHRIWDKHEPKGVTYAVSI